MSLFPNIETVDQYRLLFPQDAVWLPVIAKFMESRGLKGTPKRSSRGSHIVFRVGDVWIKFMAPLLAKDMEYEIAGLECVSCLDVVTPKILEKGVFEDWPFVMLSHVPGERVGDIFANLSEDKQIKLAADIARVTKLIHQASPNKTVLKRGAWNPFIRERIQNLRRHHENKGLQGKWLDNVESFVAKFPEEEFLHDQPPFLHADLTFDHFLVDTNSNKVTGVIDFADCRIGHPEYEIIASAIFIFKKNSKPLKHYLEVMGIKELNARFSEKLMAWTLLHFYSNLKTYFSQEMLEIDAGNFSKLAHLTFPL